MRRFRHRLFGRRVGPQAAGARRARTEDDEKRRLDRVRFWEVSDIAPNDPIEKMSILDRFSHPIAETARAVSWLKLHLSVHGENALETKFQGSGKSNPHL